MTALEILAELQALGRPGTKKVLANHGAKEPCYGVRIGDMKPIQKRIRTNYQLALDLYATGVYDAMYLAGLIADDARMTKSDLQRWAGQAYGGSLGSTTVASVAAGNPHGLELAREWVDAPEPHIAVTGWATLSAIVSVKGDRGISERELKTLLKRVEKTIHTAPDPVRYQMNAFLIATGCYVPSLTDLAIATAERIGPVTADMGDTACAVPSAPDYIRKVQARGTIGKTRKSAKC